MVFAQLLLMLVVILIAAEVFTNALEHLGEKLGISEGVTGSLFAAIGTALPETIVPLLALLAGTASPTTNEDIGIGAILGAPLMLSTLSISLLAFAVWRKRGTRGVFHPEISGLTRDLNVFIIAFSLATLALFVPHTQDLVRFAIAFGMVMIYFLYVLSTLRASNALVEEGHGTEAETPMLLCRLGLPNHLAVMMLQLGLSLGLLLWGARGFINGVEAAAPLLGISALVLSLLIIPIATELPEKVNSILWIRRDKDTLAFGNITGALVFQGTLLPAMGIILTPWTPRAEVLFSILFTLIATVWLRVILSQGNLKVWHVWVNGILYCIYLGFVFAR